MNRTFPAAAMTAAALLLLVGCTGDAEPDTAATAEDESTGQSQDAPGDDGQSVEDACAVIAQTSASSLSGERPDERPSGPKSVIWSSSFSNRAAWLTLPCS